jgi:N-dimethylarginine dimethylaminohydrolase
MKLLMCAPTYYGIEYEINPWMSRSQPSNRAQACAQWDRLRRLLEERLAVDIHTIEIAARAPGHGFYRERRPGLETQVYC